MVPGISVQNTLFHRIAPHQWGDDTSVKENVSEETARDLCC